MGGLHRIDHDRTETVGGMSKNKKEMRTGYFLYLFYEKMIFLMPKLLNFYQKCDILSIPKQDHIMEVIYETYYRR